jgi:flagellar hook protein FlgE
MTISATSAGLSGLQAAGVRLRASAHNVANWMTEDFHPERVIQSARAEGGVSTQVERSAEPQPVDLAEQLVEQRLAALQGRACLRVIDTELDMLGSLLDLTA